MNEKTLRWAAKQMEQLRKPALAGRAHGEEERYMEPGYQPDRDSICYDCQHYKPAGECDEKSCQNDIQCGGACGCREPCLAGDRNDYQRD